MPAELRVELFWGLKVLTRASKHIPWATGASEDLMPPTITYFRLGKCVHKYYENANAKRYNPTRTVFWFSNHEGWNLGM